MCRIEGGEFYDRALASKPGGFALFCTMCPQPGVNLVLAKDDPEWLKSINLMADGNFKQEHMKMRGNPNMDIRLRDGTRFMVKSGPFEEYLAKTPNASRNQKASYQ